MLSGSEQHRLVKEENLLYGIAPLRGWVKMFEYILHLSDKLELKKRTIRGITPEQKHQYEARRKSIQKSLENELGLLVDRIVLGKGTSNSGNLARRFLRNYKEVSEITSIDEESIKRLYIIMVCLSCCKELNLVAFEKYVADTATRFVDLYSWYYMPVGVHKLLIHSVVAIRKMPLPIGFFSEEALEASNKVYRRVRGTRTRKDLREHTIEDILHHMLAYSDPYLSTLCHVDRARMSLPQEAKNLLLDHNADDTDDEDEDEDVQYIHIDFDL